MPVRLLFSLLLCQFICNNSVFSQIITSEPITENRNLSDYEHGFLPSTNFPIYNTIDKYNFNGLKIRVELFDNRKKLHLEKISCSDIEITNKSEFNSAEVISNVKEYIESIFNQANILIDSSSSNKLKIKIEVIDARIFGFVFLKTHGLCQIQFTYNGNTHSYCKDLIVGDEHSPLGKFSWASRQGATSRMISASIREVIEQFLKELKQTVK